MAQDAEDWQEVTEAERRLPQVEQSLGAKSTCWQCRKVHYSSRAKSTRGQSTSGARGEAVVPALVGLSVGNFGEDETCIWIKGKVRQWSNNDAGVVELVQYLECLPLTIWQVTAYARVYNTATVEEY